MSSSMNYIGSISILDRGDAPAQAIIDKNARSLAQRVADETRDELNKVMSRVHTIYGNMETVEDVYPSTNMEYLNDLAELEAILKDEIKKRQYQQQVTVFVVGYQDVCHQKLRLLQQVNEFFLENSKNIDEEDWFPSTPDLDMDDVSYAVEESLNHAHDLTVRLAELNREMVDYMATIAEKKASNKGRKKIEKALQQAKDEVGALSDKLLTLQSELDDREEKMQNAQKSMELKNLELQKYKTAAELGKKAAEDMDELQKLLVSKEAKIIAQRNQLSKMEVELTQVSHLKDKTEMKFISSDEESQHKLVKLQQDLEEQKKANEELKNDMNKLLDNQIHALHESHQQEIEQLKREQLELNKDLKEELESVKQQYNQTQHDLITLQLEKREPPVDTPSEVARIFDLVDSEPSRQTSRQSSKQESRPSTKDTRTSSKAAGKGSKSPSRQGKVGSRTSGSKSETSKEYAEASVQDEGGDPNTATVDDKLITPSTRHSKRSKSNLDPVLESDYDNAFDLFDEESWSAISGDQMSGRFAQYRRLSKHRLLELEEQLQLNQAKTKRKVMTLKAQFQEHKGKWEAERKILIEQVDQSLRLQTDAEKEADAAMTQLEDFITEQERLEQEEESKRGEILQASASLTPEGAMTPAQRSPNAGVAPGPQQVMLTPESEQELQRLMQQTDDAKVQELNARLGTCVSAPPAVDTDTASNGKADGAESLSSFDGTKVDPVKDEELRSVSAQSRASLRSVYKVKLEESKSAAEERRSKSPAIQLPTKMTVDAELILDDDDNDEDDEELFNDMLKDPSMYEIGTSPPPGILSRDSTMPEKLDFDENEKLKGMPGYISRQLSKEPSDHGKQQERPIQKFLRKGKSVLSHPLLKEFLTAYESVVGFKNVMSKMFLDKDMMSAHQITSDLETLNFDQGQKVMPQIELLTKNANYVLEEISSLITNILVYDREPPVSSLMQFSREPTQTFVGPASATQRPNSISEGLPEPNAISPTTGYGRSTSSAIKEKENENVRMASASSDKLHIHELQDQYNLIKDQLDADKQQHQEQLQHNTVVMMGMQDTINDLQRELSTLGRAAASKKNGRLSKPQSSSSQRGQGDKTPGTPEGTIMFTRLDSERNAKVMKRAVMEQKINPEKYKEAVSRMDEYVSLPAQRLSHLVKKYVHHMNMKDIEENVKKSSSIDEEVFDVLDKMETLQNQRARQWAERMDEMGIERLRLANLLMTTLDDIEQESGIFLIKPMFSYRGRDMKHGGQRAKVTRPSKSQHQHRTITPSYDVANSFMPAPTPASNYRLVKHERHFLMQQQQQSNLVGEMKPSEITRPVSLENGEPKIMGNGLTFTAASPRATWNMQASHPWTGKEDPNAFNTPRILELDINRMMIGQNNISSRFSFPLTEDRLVNASQNSLRSYVTVNRPTAKFGNDRPNTNGSSQDQRPSSRSSGKQVQVSEVDREIPEKIATPPPLPPITPTQTLENDVNTSDEEEGHKNNKNGAQDVRPPSVAFTNEETDEEMEDNSNTNKKGKEPPESPPGSSLYQSMTNRPEDSDLGRKATRTLSGFSLSEDD